MDSKKKNLTVCILFGLLLAVAFLACLFLPKEATSDSERRKLAAHAGVHLGYRTERAVHVRL